MKKCILCFALLALSATSCRFFYLSGDASIEGNHFVRGEGEIVTESYAVPEFDEVAISSFVDVQYIQSDDEPSVIVEAYENLQEYLKFEVEGTTLKIKANYARISSDQPIIVTLNSKSLNSVSISGSGDFTADMLTTDSFAAKISGSGDIRINGLYAASLAMAIAGSGDISVNDYAGSEVNGAIAGSGDITIAGKADKAEFSIAGAGDIWLENFSTGLMNSKVSGSGEIHQ